MIGDGFLAPLVSRIVGLEPHEPVGADVLAIVRRAIGARPPKLQRQLGLLLGIIRWSPVLRHGRPFERLDVSQQVAVLAWWQDAPIPLLRSGFWGVKALAFMGYYGRPGCGDQWGYRPSPEGNEVLRHARV